MLSTFFPLFSLLSSCFVLMLGFGLIGTLLPTRMALENIHTSTIGFVLSLYALGMFFGGYLSRKLIARVGHIRIFAASAALAAISILVCGLWVNEWLWAIMRMCMGFSVACAFAVVDGWLSESASETNRGRLLATSQIVIMAGLFLSQFLLNLASPATHQLFMLAGILLCAALLPLIMSRRSGPTMHDLQGMSFQRLILASPLGVVTCFFSGLLYSALINMLPLYAAHYNLAGFQLSLFMATAVLGGFVLQLPVGSLADRFDRRTILALFLAVNMGVTLAVPLAAGNNLPLLMLAVGCITGFITCLYPLALLKLSTAFSAAKWLLPWVDC